MGALAMDPLAKAESLGSYWRDTMCQTVQLGLENAAEDTRLEFN
jgi:hypothetical protein